MSLSRIYPAKRLIADCRLVLCFLVGLLLGQACSPLRNLEKRRLSSRAISDSSMHLDQRLERKEKSASLRLVQHKDSLDRAYSIQIWPKGPFSYNLKKGFSGEAEKMEIRGHQLKQSNMSIAEYAEASKDQEAQNRVDVKQHHVQKQDQQDVKKSVSWKTVLGYGLVAFCLAAAFLLFRRIA